MLFRILHHVLAVALLAGLCACKERSGQKQAAAGPATNQPVAWSWDAYPLVPRMRVAALPCQLQPKSQIALHSPLLGLLRVHISKPQTNLPAGFVWGEFEPAIFASEAEALEEAHVKLIERERIYHEFELPRQKLQLERQIEDAQRQLRLLSLLSTNPALAQAAMSSPGVANPLLRPDALAKAQTEVALLQTNLSYLEATNLTALGVDIQGQKSDLRRRQLDFERRQTQARLKMPFTGQLTVALPLTEGVEEYPVTLGQELAVARDLSLIRVRMPIANAAWSGLPSEKLAAVIRGPTGEEIHGVYLFQKLERVQNREEAVFYFELPRQKSAAAARLMGTDVSSELWITLDKPARVVPKLTLLMLKPEAFRGRSWAQGVAVAWPGGRMVVEGQTELAIEPP